MSNVDVIQPIASTAWTSAPAQKVILHDVSWETYEGLLTEHTSSGTHFAYDRGTLEIMVLSIQHETLKHLLALMVDLIAGELDVDLYAAGSTTFRRHDLARGFEPDACFYFQHVDLIRGKNQIDLSVDPPPDLIIEIDITSPSFNKFPIFAGLGIPEVWRYEGERVSIWYLQNEEYHELAESRVLPNVNGAILTELLEAGRQMKRPAWLKRVKASVHSNQYT
jgi:Uma2 family endonuclease